MLTGHIQEQIKQHAISTPHQEVCGVLLQDDTVVPLTNVSPEPSHNFIINPEEFDALSDVKAVYHSHCLESQPGYLSPGDIANSKAIKLPYILYHSLFNEWDLYNPNELYPYPLIPNSYTPKDIEFYLGWKFEYNRSDCYTLVRSYYQGMLNINLPDYPRNDISETTSTDWNMFVENFQKAGFIQLQHDEPLNANDLIFMCILGNQTHHAAILLDPTNGKTLHNLGEGRLSELIMYGGYWITATRLVCRHKSLI